MRRCTPNSATRSTWRLNRSLQALAAALRARALPWIRDVVPALCGIAVHFDPFHPALPASVLEYFEQLLRGMLQVGLEIRGFRAHGRGPGLLRPGFWRWIWRRFPQRRRFRRKKFRSGTPRPSTRVLMVGFLAGAALHRRPRSEAVGAAARDAAHADAGGRGGDRQRADRGLSLRDAGRLEHHRPHAAARCSIRRASPRACSRRETACASSPSRETEFERLRNEPAHPPAGIADHGAGPRPLRPAAPGRGALRRDGPGRARTRQRPGRQPRGEAALEITVLGPEIAFEADALIALCGAEFDATARRRADAREPARSCVEKARC